MALVSKLRTPLAMQYECHHISSLPVPILHESDVTDPPRVLGRVGREGSLSQTGKSARIRMLAPHDNIERAGIAFQQLLFSVKRLLSDLYTDSRVLAEPCGQCLLPLYEAVHGLRPRDRLLLQLDGKERQAQGRTRQVGLGSSKTRNASALRRLAVSSSSAGVTGGVASVTA